MKVLLTGSTGYIGGQILKNCITDPRITSIVALSRKPITSVTSDKLQVVIVKDFAQYDDAALQHFRDADACIWCQGLALPPNAEVADALTFTYPLAFLEAINKARAGKPFRFVYCSGRYVMRDQSQSLWFLEANRKKRGRGEQQFLDFGAAHPPMEVLIARPGVVTTNPLTLLLFMGAAIHNNTLANGFIELAVGAKESKQTFENEDLKVKGKR